MIALIVLSGNSGEMPHYTFTEHEVPSSFSFTSFVLATVQNQKGYSVKLKSCTSSHFEKQSRVNI